MTIQNKGILSAISGILGAAATIDGKFDDRALPRLLPVDPADLLQPNGTTSSPLAPPPPLLTGVTAHETTNAVFGDLKNEFMENVKNIPDFLQKVILKPLKTYLPKLIAPLKELDRAIPLSELESSVGKIVPLDLNRYYSSIKDNQNGILNITSALLQIAEATGDALFNLPAFLTAQYWSQGSSAYLYNFEHIGKQTKGKHFLGGLPIVGKKDGDELKEYVSHGDELAYLFEPLDINGNSIEDNPNETTRGKRQVEKDEQVREMFTSLVAKFLHTGKLYSGGNKEIPSFNNKDNAFISIGKSIKVSNKFRFCQMGLWGGLADRLQTSTCASLGAISEGLNKVIAPTKIVTNALPIPPATVPKVTNVLSSGSLDSIFGK